MANHNKTCQIEDILKQPGNNSDWMLTEILPCYKKAIHSVVFKTMNTSFKGKHVVRTCEEHFDLLAKHYNEELIGQDTNRSLSSALFRRNQL